MSQFGQGPADSILKPRDLGQLLDQSFKVFGRSWKPLISVGLLVAIPSVIGTLFFLSAYPTDMDNPASSWMFPLIADAGRGDFSGMVALASIFGIMMLAGLLLAPLYYGAVVDVATRAVLHMEPVPIMESLRIGARRYWSLLGTFLLKGVIWIVALPVMVIGGLVIFSPITVPLGSFALAVVTVFTTHAIIVEGRGGGLPALTRAYELGRSRFWPLMGYGIVFYLLVYIIQSIITVPFSLGSGILAATTESPILMGIGYVVQGLSQAVAMPFLMVGLTLVYFDTRIRREGYDLEVLAQQQGQQPAIAPPPSDPWRQ